MKSSDLAQFLRGKRASVVNIKSGKAITFIDKNEKLSAFFVVPCISHYGVLESFFLSLGFPYFQGN